VLTRPDLRYGWSLPLAISLVEARWSARKSWHRHCNWETAEVVPSTSEIAMVLRGTSATPPGAVRDPPPVLRSAASFVGLLRQVPA